MKKTQANILLFELAQMASQHDLIIKTFVDMSPTGNFASSSKANSYG